jgi:Flp pilus assembly protein TadB
MLKPVLQLAAVGVVGIIAWKLAAAFLLPLFFFVFKIALIAGLIMLAFWFFNKKSRGKEDTPPAAS